MLSRYITAMLTPTCLAVGASVANSANARVPGVVALTRRPVLAWTFAAVIYDKERIGVWHRTLTTWVVLTISTHVFLLDLINYF